MSASLLSLNVSHPPISGVLLSQDTAHCYGCSVFPNPMSCLRLDLQCKRPGFDPWVGKNLWRRERLPTSVFGPGEFHGLYSPWGRKESDTTERLSLSRFEGSLILFYSQKIYMWLTEGKDPEEMKETEGGKRQKNWWVRSQGQSERHRILLTSALEKKSTHPHLREEGRGWRSTVRVQFKGRK